MGSKITTKKLAKNVLLSIVAQIISLAVSFVMGLIVPKFIDEYHYAYWQLYILYVGYVGILHFGLLDGLMLRYGAYDYDELDKKCVRSQFLCLIAITSLSAVILAVAAAAVMDGAERIIFILVACGVVIKNLTTYNAHIFQLTNRINQYVFVTIAQRITYGVFVVVLLICGVREFYWFCIADLCGEAAGIAIGVVFNKGSLYFGTVSSPRKMFSEFRQNVSSGMILLLANWSALLLIGSARMIIEWRWGELVFGQVAFAFSLTNIFLTFVTAVGIVLFPSLKRLQQEELPQIYEKIRSGISPVLFFALLLYFPGSVLVRMWLPAYTDSLQYLAILLPIIIFSSKVNLLTNNYLKVYRKERSMLVVNVVSVAVGVAMFALCAYVFDALNALLVCTVLAVMFNSVLSEIVVMRVIGVRIVKEFLYEGALTVGFILSARLLGTGWGCLAYFVLFAGYCILHYREIVALFGKLFRRKAPAAAAGEDGGDSAPAAAADDMAEPSVPAAAEEEKKDAEGGEETK